MLPFIIAIIFAVGSCAVCILMVKETNKRVKNIQSQNIDCSDIKPYRSDGMMYAILVGIVGLSAWCGFCVGSQKFVWVAMVELGACYMAALAAAVIDLKTKTIPNYIPLSIFLLRILAFIYELLFTESALGYMLSSIFGCLVCVSLLAIANKLSKGGIGGGDIKLLAAVGFMCGIYVVCSTLLLALFACIVISAVLLGLKKCTRKDSVPFGPFIWVGFLFMIIMKMY